MGGFVVGSVKIEFCSTGCLLLMKHKRSLSTVLCELFDKSQNVFVVKHMKCAEKHFIILFSIFQ
jgi:hypothetical protein